MEYYVGLDVSLKQTSICVVNQTGSVVREGVVDSDPEAIAAFVRAKAPGAVRIGLETGPTATWLWTELKRLCLPVICIDARHAKAVLKMQINKSDRNDAVGIARVMRDLCESGFHEYNLGGSPADATGLMRFKAGWGAPGLTLGRRLRASDSRHRSSAALSWRPRRPPRP